MIKIIKQNLFTIKRLSNEYLAHCISADFKLGAGIAREFQRIFQTKSLLHVFYKQNQWSNKGYCLETTHEIFNLVTKDKFYNKPTYKTLIEALENMKKQCIEKNIQKVYMPKIGCGLDKLDWETVLNILKQLFENTKIDIVICEL